MMKAVRLSSKRNFFLVMQYLISRLYVYLKYPVITFVYFAHAFNDLNIYLQVENNEERNEMPYGSEPETEFQRFIRQRRDGELMAS